MRRYTHLPVPNAPLTDKERHGHWDASMTFSHKTIPTYWHEDTVYLYGVDLFNAELFWEAHEVWEKKWHYSKAYHPDFADWIQGLIQVSAACLKRSEQNQQGFIHNIKKAQQHLQTYIYLKTVMGIEVDSWLQILHAFAGNDIHSISVYPKIALTFP
ncbi:MAG: DUF309 domain-containing protein [Deltaproteobacteria bacterium]|nr:DUF309 domain-containing protein [Deltaproteobacteria bacterium]